MINGGMLVEKRLDNEKTNWHWNIDQRPMMMNSNPYLSIEVLEKYDEKIRLKMPIENKPPREFSPEKPLAAN